jgi:hypothetical protein
MKVLPSSLPDGGIWIVLASAVLLTLGWVLVASWRGRRRGSGSVPVPAVGPVVPPTAGSPGEGREAQADRAVASVRDRLVGRSLDRVRVGSVFHYGAVDIDPGHLVVWVLLEGRGAETVPAWYAPGSGAPLPPGWEAWLVSLREEVRAGLAQAGWPAAGSVRVLVDADARVRAGGGWSYFR